MKRFVFRMLRLCFKILPRKPIVTANIQSILVIKLCCIGDVLFTTPLLRALGENFPRAKITYMVSAWCSELAAADSRVSKIIEFNAYEKNSWLIKLKHAWKVIREVRRGRFDLALVLHRTPLAGLLAAFGGVPVRIGFDWEEAGFAHTHPIAFRSEAHEVDRQLDCLKPLNAKDKGQWLEFSPPTAAEEEAEVFLKENNFDKQAGPLIVLFPAGGINPGTSMVTKRWPTAGYREICRRLVEYYQARILLVGNKSDAVVGDQLVIAKLNGPPMIRAEGRTSLLVLGALLKRCTLFIGGDSGPLHLAAAVSIPTVSIFGPTDYRLLAPRGTQHLVVNKYLPCSPCYNPITVRKTNVTVCKINSLACMRDITANDVMEAVEELLSKKGFNRK